MAEHQSDHSTDHQCCTCHRSSTLGQSLDEMDFERGLWSAALNGETERLEKLLESGQDPSLTDSSGYTPLHYAARSGHLDACERLIDHGACVNATTRTGHVTPLHRATYCGHVRVVKLLLKRGANPVLRDSDRKTALHKCAETNQMEIACILLTSDPQLVDLVDLRGKKAADYVTFEGNRESFRQLLGASVEG